MSSDKQDASPQQQRDELAKLAARDGFHLVGEYFDDAISGDRTDKRHGFQRMIARRGRREVQGHLCWDQDRFGRVRQRRSGFYIHPLRQAGVKLVTVAQGAVDWTTFAGRLIYSVQQEGKHAYLGRPVPQHAAWSDCGGKRGEWLSPPPLGYRVENKRLVVGDPRDVATVTPDIPRIPRWSFAACHRGEAEHRGISRHNAATAWDGTRSGIFCRTRVRRSVSCGTTTTGKYHVPAWWRVLAVFHVVATAMRSSSRTTTPPSSTRRRSTRSSGGLARTSDVDHATPRRRWVRVHGNCKCGKCGGPDVRCRPTAIVGIGATRHGAGNLRLERDRPSRVAGRGSRCHRIAVHNPKTVERLRCHHVQQGN